MVKKTGEAGKAEVQAYYADVRLTACGPRAGRYLGGQPGRRRERRRGWRGREAERGRRGGGV